MAMLHTAPTSAAFHRVGFNSSAGKFLGVTDAMLTRWQTLHPGISIPTELDRAACWLLCNPTKRPRAWDHDFSGFLSARFRRIERAAAREADELSSAAIGHASRQRRPI